MNMISNENQAINKTLTLWQLYAKACTKVEKIELDLVNVKCVSCVTEQRCSHPNETRDDIEVIGHVPKLMTIWLTKFLKRATNSGKAVIREASEEMEVETMDWKFHANFILQEMNFRSTG